MTKTFTVSYEIEIEADSPQDAARIALERVRDTTASATWDTVDEHGEFDRVTVLPDGGIETEEQWGH